MSETNQNPLLPEEESNEEILFAEEEPEQPQTEETWKILIVDDDAEVHSVTKLALKKFTYAGKSLSFLSAYSGEEAKELIKYQPDIAMILLDVVMETDDSGLALVNYIRDSLNNEVVRIIVRTGQPGKAPETTVILNYQIDDYKTKTELTKPKLMTAIVTALRAFSAIAKLEQDKIIIEKIAKQNAQLYQQKKKYADILEAMIEERTQALRTKEARLAEAQKLAHLGSWEYDITTQKLTWSDELLRIFGRNPQQEELTLQMCRSQIHPDDYEFWVRKLTQARESGESYELDFRIVQPDGSVRYVFSKGEAQADAEGGVIKVFGTVQDISDRIITETALRESEQRFRAIFEQASVAIAISAPSGQFLRLNQKLCDLLGYTESELLSKTFQEITHPDDLEMDLRYYRQVLTGKIKTYSLEKRYIRKDRRLQWGNLTVSVVLEGDRAISYIMAAIEDIQERKYAEKQLQYRLLLETALAEVSRELAINEAADIDRVMGILGVAVGANHTYVTRFRGNSTIADMVYEWCDSQTQPQIENFQNVDSSLFPWWLEKYQKNENAVISDVDALPEAAELEKNLLKSLGVCSVLAVPINTQSGQPWGTIGFENIGENRKEWSQEDVQLLRIVGEMIYSYCTRSQAVAEKLRQAQYQQLLASLTLRIRESLSIEEILQTTVTQVQTTLNADRVLFFRLLPETGGKVVNEAVVTGFPTMLGQIIEDEGLSAQCLEKYRQGNIHVCSDVESAGFISCYLEFLQQYQIRSNLIVPILVRNQVNIAHNYDTQDAESTANSQSQAPVKLWGLLCVQQCGETRQWTDLEIELLQQLANQLGIALYQAQLLENQTRYSQELARSNAELEQFAYVASHDLQAPLGTIASYAELLEERYKDILDAKANNYIDKIVSGVIRMQRLIDDLLLYSRVGRSQKPFEPCDCNLVFEEACANLQATISKSQASVTKRELPVVIADTSQLVQLFQNLIGNGIKYRREEPPLIQVSASAQEGAWLFSVSDNGIGIDPKQSDRIFQIFQRLHTQKEYSGTGIGLAICQKIVERHGGRIWVESAPSQGSTFYFTLPNNNL